MFIQRWSKDLYMKDRFVSFHIYDKSSLVTKLSICENVICFNLKDIFFCIHANSHQFNWYLHNRQIYKYYLDFNLFISTFPLWTNFLLNHTEKKNNFIILENPFFHVKLHQPKFIYYVYSTQIYLFWLSGSLDS